VRERESAAVVAEGTERVQDSPVSFAYQPMGKGARIGGIDPTVLIAMSVDTLRGANLPPQAGSIDAAISCLRPWVPHLRGGRTPNNNLLQESRFNQLPQPSICFERFGARTAHPMAATGE